MLAFICLFIPALLTLCIRMKLKGIQKIGREQLVEYLLAVLFVNLATLSVTYFVFQSTEVLVGKLNQYNGFAWKYMILSVGFAILLPIAEKFIIESVQVTCECSRKISGARQWLYRFGIFYGIFLFLLNFVRIFDQNFWGDEAYTTLLVQKSIPEILSTTAADVHPPLYYLIVKVGYSLFGDQGWMFHLMSLIPSILLLLIALTVFWRKFGAIATLIFMTFLGLSPTAVAYNMEVRMYSWGGFFVLMSFYALHCILQKERKRDYILFVLSSLAAAYTHYWCVIIVAFYYLVLFVVAFWTKWVSWKKVLIVYVCTVLAYLPWLGIWIRTIQQKSESYWITYIPSFKESMGYLFSSRWNTLLWCFTGLALVFFLLYESKMLRIGKKDKNLQIHISCMENVCTKQMVWVLAGILSVVGTILLAILISKLIRPFYCLRYIYPATLVAWLVLGILISRLRGRKIYACVLLLFLVKTFYPLYQQTYESQKNQNQVLEETLKVVEENLEVGTIIFTPIDHMAWTIAPYYFQGYEVHKLTTDGLAQMEKNQTYWVIVGAGDTTWIEQIQEKRFTTEMIYEGGHLGSHWVDVYEVSK
jgi:hypothetical protein